MKEQAEDLARQLAAAYGSAVTVEYKDVFTDEMSAYPDILNLVMMGRVRLPIVSFNDTPTFAGGLGFEMICAEVEKLGAKPLGAAPEA